MRSSSRKRKGQAWTIDYTLGLLLFLLAAAFSVKIIINSFSESNAFQEIRMDAAKASEVLLSEGYPDPWSNTTVIRPGILSDGRVDTGKLSLAANLSYPAFKSLLKTKSDFLVIFEDKNGLMLEFNGSCKLGSDAVAINSTTLMTGEVDCLNPDFSSINYDNLVKITRLAILNSTIVRMEVYAWQ